ncbi:hypothetical protein BP5796_09687 [Coleophoma crateriformis]|uniref:Uncharacterized protein n=1 Tax=Coleophoma crateriformis TaxID=565419 RepID=A0A3D8QZ26_9HELO|nr:hypothetical protein BP5796_09687 [Coleophoma crateriformis]
MAPTNTRQPAPILPPSTPANPNNARPQSSTQSHENAPPSSSSTPMHPPSLPRSLMAPARDVREASVTSSVGGSARKPRQNLSESDHILMLKACYGQRHKFKEGTKAEFWGGVNQAFQADTGKILAQMSATVGRLVEGRRRQISDWENGIITQKPGGELNELLDKWIEFLRVEDADAEAERVRQVDARRRLEEQRKEARRQADAAQALMTAQNASIAAAPPANMQPQQQGNDDVYITNGQEHNAINGLERPRKRQRTERQLTRELTELQSQIQQEARQYQELQLREPVKRVVVEGQLTKEDWRDIMGNDARLRALESKVDKIEVIVSQNNKLLMQLLQSSGKDRHEDDGRVPVHLDAEFERDYL